MPPTGVTQGKPVVLPIYPVLKNYYPELHLERSEQRTAGGNYGLVGIFGGLGDWGVQRSFGAGPDQGTGGIQVDCLRAGTRDRGSTGNSGALGGTGSFSGVRQGRIHKPMLVLECPYCFYNKGNKYLCLIISAYFQRTTVHWFNECTLQGKSRKEYRNSDTSLFDSKSAVEKSALV